MPKKLYEVLGLDNEQSSKDEIRKAYHKKALQFHPDKNQGDPSAAEKFKQVGAAYSILGDEVKRGQYDSGLIDEAGNLIETQSPTPPRARQQRQEETVRPQPTRKTTSHEPHYDSNRFYPRPSPTYYMFYNSSADANTYKRPEQTPVFIYKTTSPLHNLFNLFTDFDAQLPGEEKAEYRYHTASSSSPEFISIKTYHAPSMDRIIDQLIAQMIILELLEQTVSLYANDIQNSR